MISRAVVAQPLAFMASMLTWQIVQRTINQALISLSGFLVRREEQQSDRGGCLM